MFRKIAFLALFILSASLTYSQCIQGIGVPISESFGSGTAEIGPPLPAGYTSLIYSASGCPFDGEYSMANYTHNCFHSWHTLTASTGDPKDYFMLVNARPQPGYFYTQTIDDLCEGATYQFSSWFINLDTVVERYEPNITFTIEKTDGTVLASLTSGAVQITNPPAWEKFFFNFTTPPGVSSVVIRMRDDADGDIGNDFAFDDIEITPIGPVDIPNTFTPNGDGINDTWDIYALRYYPDCRIYIFNRTGQTVFSSIGYAKPWDGTYNGKPLPVGTYYYIINLRNHARVLSGSITILR
jgi:gliding motility-associated-like protein